MRIELVSRGYRPSSIAVRDLRSGSYIMSSVLLYTNNGNVAPVAVGFLFAVHASRFHRPEATRREQGEPLSWAFVSVARRHSRCCR